MKNYTAPQMNVIDNWSELNINPATLEWTIDNDKNQIIVTSRYEEIEPTYEDDECRYFKLRKEPVNVLSVDCDPEEIEIIKEGVDEEGNKFKTIVTKKQLVAFETGSYDSAVRESMNSNYEEFEVHYTDLNGYTIAFHKDGRWWFLDLSIEGPGYISLTEYDEEDNIIEVPFSCETISELTEYEPYIRGEKNGYFDEGLYGTNLLLVCEDGEDQYGINIVCGSGSVELLSDNRYGENTKTPFTKISLVGDITVRIKEDEEGIVQQQIGHNFHYPIVQYDRENETSEIIQWSVINDSIMRIVQGNNVIFCIAKTDLFVSAEEEKNELLREIKSRMFRDLRFDFTAQDGDYFVVKHTETSGYVNKTKYRIIYKDSYIEGLWDDVEILSTDFEPVFCIKKDGLWGIINEFGTIVAPVHYTRINAVKNAEIMLDDKKIIYELYLEEFGRKGFGVLIGNEYKVFNSLFSWDDDESASVSYKCDEFSQIIPCEYECVKASFGIFGNEIKVEKMGRVASYDLNGRLKDEFKPGRI